MDHAFFFAGQKAQASFKCCFPGSHVLGAPEKEKEEKLQTSVRHRRLPSPQFVLITSNNKNNGFARGLELPSSSPSKNFTISDGASLWVTNNIIPLGAAPSYYYYEPPHFPVIHDPID